MRANERRFNKRNPHAREERCERCMAEDIAPRRQQEEEPESPEEAYADIKDVEEAYADKLETLMQEARGEKSKDEEFDANNLTIVIKEDGEIMVLQLHDQEQGDPV